MALTSAGTADVSVIIVNWNSSRLLRECLTSVQEGERSSGAALETIVVDNGSEDDSLSTVADYRDVVLISNAANLGFAAACNAGARAARGRYLLFLNPDCRMTGASVEACCSALRRDPSVGVVGVALADDSGRVARSCHYFPSLHHFLLRLSGLSALSGRFPDGSMRDWAHDSDRFVDHVIGAFYMVRRDEFLAIGGFDERFFVYLEDLDLSLRYRRRGQRCLFLASPASYHKGGGASERARATRLFYATRSRILYAFKHFSWIQGWIHCLATLSIEPIARLVQLVCKARLLEIGETMQGFVMLFRDLPGTIRLARQR